MFEKEDALSEYNKRVAQLIELSKKIDMFLKEQCAAKSIGTASISSRIKTFDSFWEKIIRKEYGDSPFEKIHDLLGVRIVYYYISDYQKILKILKDEFEIVEEINKKEDLEFNQFGYLSNHFIIQSPKEMGGLKAEIQVRTFLMHVWAEIEHKLAYKSKAQIPNVLRRKFSQLAALLEIADERFDEIRCDRDNFLENLELHINKVGEFDHYAELNLDTLQAFFDFYLPDRERDSKKARALFSEITFLNLTIKNLINYFNIGVKDSLRFERELGGKTHSQVDFFRIVLDLTCDSFWQERKYKIMPMGYIPLCERIRKELGLLVNRRNYC